MKKCWSLKLRGRFLGEELGRQTWYSGLRIGIILYTNVVLFFVQYNWVDFGGVRLEEGFCIVEFLLWRV